MLSPLSLSSLGPFGSSADRTKQIENLVNSLRDELLDFNIYLHTFIIRFCSETGRIILIVVNRKWKVENFENGKT